jgi:YVTN family beta-propeller protein
MRRRVLILGSVCLAAALTAHAAGKGARKLYVCNTSGDSLSVIDLETRRAGPEIKTGSHPHGLAASPDGRRLYCSVESDHTVKVIDTASDRILSSIPLTGMPNQLAITPDGKWIYVAIADKGTDDVIDVAEQKVVKELPIGRHPHNCYCPKGGKYMYATSISEKLVKKFDYRNGHKEVQTVRFYAPVRPLCITRDEKRLFVALEGLHGFAWADLESGQELGHVDMPLPPVEKRSKFAYLNTHGLDLRPGDKELWVTSFIGNGLMVFDVRDPGPVYLTTVPVGDAPNWLTFSPDGKYCYSADAGENSVSIVDCSARKKVASVKVGAVPKRLLEVRVPGA